MTRKIKYLAIQPDIVFSKFVEIQGDFDHMVRTTFTELPEDFKLEGVNYDAYGQRFLFCISHDSFPELSITEQPPVIEGVCHSIRLRIPASEYNKTLSKLSAEIAWYTNKLKYYEANSKIDHKRLYEQAVECMSYAGIIGWHPDKTPVYTFWWRRLRIFMKGLFS